MTAIQRKGAAWALLPLLLCCGAADARAGGDGPGALAEVSGYRPALRDGETLDLYVYLSTQQDPFLARAWRGRDHTSPYQCRRPGSFLLCIVIICVLHTF